MKPEARSHRFFGQVGPNFRPCQSARGHLPILHAQAVLGHIDAIARQNQRGVLVVQSHPMALNPKAEESLSEHDIWA